MKQKSKSRRKGMVDVYRDVQGQWRWRAFSANGNNVANAGEGYTRKAWAKRMAKVEADARGYELVVEE